MARFSGTKLKRSCHCPKPVAHIPRDTLKNAPAALPNLAGWQTLGFEILRAQVIRRPRRESASEEKLPAARGKNLLQAAITSSKGQVLGAWVSSLELVSCFTAMVFQNGGGSVLGACASRLELVSCGIELGLAVSS